MLEFQANLFFCRAYASPPQSPAVVPQPSHEARPERIEIIEAFADRVKPLGSVITWPSVWRSSL